MLSRLTLSCTDRLFSTFCRLTLTSVGMLVPPLLVPDPLGAGAGLPGTGVGVEALTSPAELGAGDWVVLHATRLRAATAAAAHIAERAVIGSSCLQAATARRGAGRRRRGCGGRRWCRRRRCRSSGR